MHKHKHEHKYYIRRNSRRPNEVLLGCEGCNEKFQARVQDGKIGQPYQVNKKKADPKIGIQLRLYKWQRARIMAAKTTAQKLLDEAVSNLPGEN